MNLKEQLKNCISIDVETTGLDPNKHSIVSIGATVFDEETATFYRENHIRDGAEFDPRALEVNGENEENLKKRKELYYASELEILLELLVFANTFGKTIIIGKNPNFDYKFLLAIWLRAGKSEKDFPLSYRLIDWTNFVIYKALLEGENVPRDGFGSNYAQSYLGLPKEPTPHNALTGAKYNKMCVEKVFGL